ncbi:hypothetical protein BH11BAC1_BH11BAC1_29780 [soil metagenome]
MFLGMLAFFTMCKKDRVPQDDYQSMDSFYNDNQEEEQELQVDSGSGGDCFVTAKKGTRICMQRDMISDAGGNEIASYPFQLKVIELYSIKDMILRKQPSTTGATILETSAEIKVRPFKDGNEAFLKQGRAYLMETDSFASLNTSLACYYGFDNGGVGDWTNMISTIIPGFVDTLSSVVATPAFYMLTPAKTGYVSAAKQHQSAAQFTPVTISVTGTNTQNIEIYLIFNNFKSVMKVTNLVSAPVPIGEVVTLVAFGKKQTNEYVLHKQTFAVAGGQQITLTMQVLSESNLLAALESL